jgi:hypothetical protein
MGWEYKRTESNNFEQIPEGKHRIRIKSVEATKSKSGNDMLAFQFDVSGYDTTLYHYISFLNDRPEITNRMLTNFFDSFKDIPEGNFKFSTWTGKVGACVVAKDKNDPTRTRLSYFIAADKQSDLPMWKEPDSGKAAGSADDIIEIIDDNDLPW